MEFVFVKDSEGFVFKKPKSELANDEMIISEKEYLRISGLGNYQKSCKILDPAAN